MILFRENLGKGYFYMNQEKKNLMLKDLDELVQTRLNTLLRKNPGRVNFYNKYKEIIDA